MKTYIDILKKKLKNAKNANSKDIRLSVDEAENLLIESLQGNGCNEKKLDQILELLKNQSDDSDEGLDGGGF